MIVRPPTGGHPLGSVPRLREIAGHRAGRSSTTRARTSCLGPARTCCAGHAYRAVK